MQFRIFFFLFFCFEIPIYDYFFRYDRGAFWGADEEPNNFNSWKCILGNQIKAENAFKVINSFDMKECFLSQTFCEDLGVPFCNALKFRKEAFHCFSALCGKIDERTWYCPYLISGNCVFVVVTLFFLPVK